MSLPLTAADKLFLRLYDEIGGVNGILEEYTNFVKDIPTLTLKAKINSINTEFNRKSPLERGDTPLITITRPKYTPRISRLNGIAYNGSISILTNSGSIKIKLPVPVGSYLCHTYGKSAKELVNIGESPTDLGGYFIVKSSSGGVTNCTHTTRKIIDPHIILSRKMDDYTIPIVLSKTERSVRRNIGSMYTACSHYCTKGLNTRSFIFMYDNILKAMLSLPKEYNMTGKHLKGIRKTPIRAKLLAIFDLLLRFKLNGYTEVNLKTNNSGMDIIPTRQQIVMEILKICDSKDYFIALLQASLIDYEYGRNLSDLIGEIITEENKDLAPYPDIFYRAIYIVNYVISSTSNINEKLYTFSYMTYKQLSAYINEKIDDPNNPAFSTYVGLSETLARCFKEALNPVTRTLDGKVASDMISRWFALSDKHVEDGDGGAMSRTNIGFKSTADTIANVTKIILPGATEHLSMEPRKIHGFSYNMICAAATPESINAGINLYFASLGHLSRNRDPEPIVEYFTSHEGYFDVNTESSEKLLLINSKIIGRCSLLLFTRARRKFKRNLRTKDVSFVICDKTLEVYTFVGNICTIFMTVSGRKLNIEGRWKDDIDTLIEDGLLEVVTAKEYFNNYRICQDLRHFYSTEEEYDLCAFDIKQLFGTIANLSPVPNTNYGVRMPYSAAMNPSHLDTSIPPLSENTVKRLCFGSRAICCTTMLEYLQSKGICNTTNGLVAILADGANYEDAMVIRAQFARSVSNTRTSTVISITHRAKRNDLTNTNDPVFEFRGILPGLANIAKFKHIDKSTGYPIIGSYVEEGEVIIARYKRDPHTSIETDSSIYASPDDTGRIIHVRTENVIDMTLSTNSRIIVTIEKVRCIAVGDKLILPTSQKGTVTQILHDKDLPCIVEGPNRGARPDVVVSPHFLPTRKTLSTIIQLICDSTAATLITRYNMDDGRVPISPGTVGRPFDYSKFEFTVLMSPKGEKINALIGIMPVSTTVHIAADKIQKGDNIPVPHTNFTRSPAGGRKDAAALRLGMADAEALAVAGSSGGIRDILLKNCDGTKSMICSSCGILIDKFKCPLCNSATIEADIRYSAILMIHACLASGVDIRLKVSTT